jgi:hypothetical protein
MAGGRVSVTIDGKKFKAIQAIFGVSTQKDQNGKPLKESLSTRVRVWADISDQQNVPFGTLKSFFDLANVATHDKIKDIKVEFWKEDKVGGDTICCYQFKGWVGKFETYNPVASKDMTSSGAESAGGYGGLGSYNNILYLELEPVIDLEKYGSVQLSN